MKTSKATIVRIVPDSLVYAITEDRSHTLAFGPSVIDNYSYQSFEELGLYEGRVLQLDWESDPREVVRAYILAPEGKNAYRDNVEPVIYKPVESEIEDLQEQKELHPDDNADDSGSINLDLPLAGDNLDEFSDLITEIQEKDGSSQDDGLSTSFSKHLTNNGFRRKHLESVELNELTPEKQSLKSMPTKKLSRNRALPPKTLAFGKIVDVEKLWPGDLLLVRETNPDQISSAIARTQEKGGYTKEHSRWTHAAMYVGDDIHVVEATFNNVLGKGDVRLTKLDAYCDGANILRFRRCNEVIEHPQKAFWICVSALGRMSKPYDFGTAILDWIKINLFGYGYYADNHEDKKKRNEKDAFICSTLIAESIQESVRYTLGEENGACVPAWLSMTDLFSDVDVNWIKIEDADVNRVKIEK